MIKTKPYFSAVLILLCWCSAASAVEIRGTVRSATKDGATIAIEGESAPNVGDPVEIYFKIPGAEEEISVGNGKVTAVRGDSVEAKIDKATGTVSKDQLARITSDKPQKGSATTPASESPKAAATERTPIPSPPVEESKSSSLIGRWAGKNRKGQEGTFIFKSDGTAILPVPEAEGLSLGGKYVVDYASKPPRFEITGLEFLPPPYLTDEELKELEEKKQSDPEGAQILGAVWIGEIDDPSHFRIQPFKKETAAAHPKVPTDAPVFTKLSEGKLPAASPVGPAPTGAPSPAVLSPSLPINAAPPRRGKLILTDDFDKPKDNLQVDGNKNVNGERQLVANPGASRLRAYYNIPRDFYAQWRMRSGTTEPSCAIGLFFRGSKNKEEVISTFYELDVQPNAISWRWFKDSVEQPRDVRQLPAGVYSDATKTVQVGLEVNGREFRVFIDDHFMASFANDAITTGDNLGFVLRSDGQMSCTAYYDSLRIYDLSAAEKKGKTGRRKSSSRNR